MIYKQFKDKKISALGLGCMRLPMLADGINMDKEKSRKIVDYAIKHGVNYFDTAWVYHAGLSEEMMGELLSQYPRDSYYVATKFPGFDNDLMAQVKPIFEKQLQKLRTDYIDFYMFHNVWEGNVDGYLDPKFGVFDYLIEQKRNGKIKHLGFSTHGSLQTMKRFLDAYGKDMEFCQLQINWMDWHYQQAQQKVDLVTSYGIPVWVMEPVRGGTLANLNALFRRQLEALNPNRTMAEWAFRFLQGIPQVVVTLSGMSNMEQLKQNIQTYQTEELLTEQETQTLFNIAHTMTTSNALPCTACRYCTPHCPQGLDIPSLVERYNEHVYSGGKTPLANLASGLPAEQLPNACIGCQACESSCPQKIKISQMMTDFAEQLNK